MHYLIYYCGINTMYNKIKNDYLVLGEGITNFENKVTKKLQISFYWSDS